MCRGSTTMEDAHIHSWTVTQLVIDPVPGIPAYVTYCDCGTPRPAGLELFAS